MRFGKVGAGKVFSWPVRYNTAMRFRKLRIAWSVGWGVVAVLLCVLWVRSSSWGEGVRYVGQERDVLFGYKVGDVFLSLYDKPSDNDDERGWELFHYPIHNPERKFFFSEDGFYRDGENNFAPFWFPILLSVMLVALPWLPMARWRFSLRTLLIITTLVAAWLRLVVWASRTG
jgi:hypothetical protein